MTTPFLLKTQTRGHEVTLRFYPPSHAYDGSMVSSFIIMALDEQNRILALKK